MIKSASITTNKGVPHQPFSKSNQAGRQFTQYRIVDSESWISVALYWIRGQVLTVGIAHPTNTLNFQAPELTEKIDARDCLEF